VWLHTISQVISPGVAVAMIYSQQAQHKEIVMKMSAFYTVSRLASYLIAGIFGFGLATRRWLKGRHRDKVRQPTTIHFLPIAIGAVAKKDCAKWKLTAATDAENQKTVARQLTNVKTDFTRIQVLRKTSLATSSPGSLSITSWCRNRRRNK